MKTMNWLLRCCLPVTVAAITLPPCGIYARAGREHEPQLSAHEQVHWEQYERMGLISFYVTYLWQLVKYGRAQHPMEREARDRSGVS